MKSKTVCIIGLGYVGLPLAKAFSRHLSVIGYDIDKQKIKELNNINNEENYFKINQIDATFIIPAYTEEEGTEEIKKTMEG